MKPFLPHERYAGNVAVQNLLPTLAALGIDISNLLAPIGYRKDGTPIYPIAGGDAAAPMLMTVEALTAAMTSAAEAGATAALRAANTVDPEATPPAVRVSNVNLRRPVQPSITRALRAIRKGSWKGAEVERDLSQATAQLVPFGTRSGSPDEDEARTDGFSIPTTPQMYRHVLEETGIRTPETELGKYAVRALGEGTSALGSVTSAGPLVPIQFLPDQFVLALTSAIVLRQMPEVTVIPVNSNIIELPRETAAAAAAAVAESGTITPNDPTLALQEFQIKKQARLQVFSNELLHDSNPAIDAVVMKMLARDVALFQDSQYLEGSGSGANVRGIRNYSGLTTSSWVAATNGSTPAADDLINMVYDIYTANANPSAFVMHPRTAKGLFKLKDATGRYIFTSYASWGGPRIASIPGSDMTYPSKAIGDLNGIPVYLSTQVLINETQGSSSLASHIIYGDFTKVFILERQAADIFMSEHYAMNADQTAIRVIARSTVAITQPTAMAVATGII